MSDHGPLRSSQAVRPPQKRDRQQPGRQSTDSLAPRPIIAGKRSDQVPPGYTCPERDGEREICFPLLISGLEIWKKRHDARAGNAGKIKTLRSEEQRALVLLGTGPAHPGRRSLQAQPPVAAPLITRQGCDVRRTRAGDRGPGGAKQRFRMGTPGADQNLHEMTQGRQVIWSLTLVLVGVRTGVSPFRLFTPPCLATT
jgi:hypothetical protein